MAWGVLMLVVVLLAMAAVLTGVTVFVMAWSLLRPPRMTDGKAVWLLQRLSPGDLGMPYEESWFDVRDQRAGASLRVAAWWIPAPGSDTALSDRCVVLLHGYADAKVGSIAWAPAWQKLGFNVFAPDLRAHGQSDGRESTAGYYERHDVDQVISRLCAERPASTRHVFLFGASLGAAVAVATAAMRDDVAGVVLESPYTDFRAAARTHMDLLGLPGGAFQNAALRLAEWLAYAKFDEVRTVNLLPAVRCPVLVIAPARDVFLGDSGMDAFATALAARPPGSGLAEIWQVEETPHLLAVHQDADAYTARLGSFVDRALAGSPKSTHPPDSAAAEGPQIAMQRE